MLKTRDCINGINIPISEQLVSVACCALPQRRRVLAAAGHFDSGNLCEREAQRENPLVSLKSAGGKFHADERTAE